MIARLIKYALQYRWAVLLIASAISIAGIFLFTQMKIDAYPDISSQMVQVITVFPGQAPEEVERQVTVPIEIAMKNVPHVETIRSRTIFGLSVVQLIFKEGTESYWARQRVQEKLALISLPAGAEAEIGPLATAYGEMVRYELVSDGRQDLIELRTLNDWVIIPRLLRAEGVAEVSNFGGFEKQYGIILNPSQLLRYGLSVQEVISAIESNNTNSGGSVLSRGGMSFVIRGTGVLKNEKEIGDVFIKSVDGQPLYLRDISSIQISKKIPAGIFSKNNEDASVEGIVLLRKGENPSDVLNRVQSAIHELNKSGLPLGVKIVPFYDRSQLIASTIHTVAHSVTFGVMLVLFILLMFLGRPALAILVALTIPFSLLFAIILMYLTGIPIGLLSIGAIDFGIIVDGAIIIAESIARALHANNEAHASNPDAPDKTIQTIAQATQEVERPVFFSVLIIVGAFLPLLTLTHIEGLLFRPMAQTIVFALIGAVIFSLFVLPVIASFLFRNGFKDTESKLLLYLKKQYHAALTWSLKHTQSIVVLSALLIGLLTIFIFPRVGSEFLPYMDEGVIWVRANFPEGTSLEQTSLFGKRLREVAMSFPDIKFVTVQAGRNDSGTDPYPPSRVEMMIGPNDPTTWTQVHSKSELITVIGNAFRTEFPTTRFNFTQPIIDSVTEDSNGTSANMAVEFSGNDSAVLLSLAKQAETLLKAIPGAVDVNIEQEGPQPQLVIEPDRALCARYKVNIIDLSTLINTAIGGSPVGVIYEDEKRFDIAVKFSSEYMNSMQSIQRLPVFNADGIPIPLSQVAKVKVVDGQTMIARADSVRRLTVRSDIQGRDQGGFVSEAQGVFAKQLKLPEGYRLNWIGMFENLDRAGKHFSILVPITILIIYLLIVAIFKSQRYALILLSTIPFAFTGGLVALYLRGMNLNVSSGVGFAAVFGISIMSGVLMIKAITTLERNGLPTDDAIIQGAMDCFRPIVIASLVAILGLLPASLAHGLGSDVQRPLSTVIVWGLGGASMMTLMLLPLIYRLSRTK